MRELTIGFSTYGQPKMLAYWFERFLAQPQEWRERVEVIVVDDAGKPPAEVPQHAGIWLARVKPDIPWNQPGARNLIAHLATTPRLMLIDPDMTLDDGMLQKLVEASRYLEAGLMFRPALKHIADGRLDHTSPNVHLILLEDFIKIGGYDEDYCGHKGWSDVQLLRVMQQALKTRTREDLWFSFHHGNKKLPDAQVNTIDRSTAHNKAIHIRKISKLKKVGWERFVKEVVGKKLRFEWEIVKWL